MTITDLNLEARKIVDADSTTYEDADLLRRINAGYEKWVGRLIAQDNNWSFGDSNYTSLPTGLSNLVAGTQAYQFPSGWLTVHSVQVLDVNGDWSVLDRVNLEDIEPITEYESTNGLPHEYAVREDFILLFPAPSATYVTTINGLKVNYERTADVFTAAQVATGTKTPGFASPFHILLAYEAAIPYAAQYKMDRLPYLISERDKIGKDLLDFYAKRDKAIRNIITTKPISYR